jgi:hypothetical protein
MVSQSVPLLLHKLCALKLGELTAFLAGAHGFGMERAAQFRTSTLFQDYAEVIEEMEASFRAFSGGLGKGQGQESPHALLRSLLAQSALSPNILNNSLFLLAMAFRELRNWAIERRVASEDICRCFLKLNQVVQALRLAELGIPPEKLCEELADIETCQADERWIKDFFCYCE